ncbi:phage tail sheath subtilisin-like domain-containing protein [Endozoicomonas euniceicola]|uniref:Phage tail sheath subtilisin-like domain-containing protein n=1 Tax=Endozoicomonas euniceicola TaxID=1234143 RepID=A0ABY6GQB1_9GAMM|nr:phage tail sheath subtilisin-like domain-containing protein [Endozoicomonas euniceicola]UYM14251.1 phage tail sheath subtilisin-like domain-containing protein [Endozoicomonas euniceicola]
MPEQFLHGVEVIEIDAGPRPIQTVKSSVIGIVGTAPDADPVAFPADTPVLVAGSLKAAAALDTKGTGAGTLPGAMDGIFDQCGAVVVVVRVEEGADDDATKQNVLGGVEADGSYTGLKALLGAESKLGFQPRLLCAPGFSHDQTIAAEMESLAAKMRAIAILDGPNKVDSDAIDYVRNFGQRCYVVDPWVIANGKAEPASARICGVIARTDNEQGFWHSPSNKPIYGITGTARPVDFVLGDTSSRANLLNEKHVSTIIRMDGYRLWGNRTCNTTDSKWFFLSVRRTADIINDSLLRAHMWAVDRNITKTYIEDVTGGVNAYLRSLQAQGAILGGECWADPDLNSPANIQLGKVFFNFDFTPPYPAEHITFRSHLVNDYLEEIL